MQFVPLKKPHSGGLSRGWRVLVLLFAGLLTLGVLQPFTASAAPNLLQVKDTTVVEADSGTTTAKVKVVLSQRAHKKVSVSYTTRDGTATAGSDYVAKTGRIYFPKGTKVAFVRVAVIGDTTDESDEYFKVRLYDPFRAKIADRVGIVDILDNDAPAPPPPPALPTLSVGDDSVYEGGKLWFKVSLSKAWTDTVTFDFATVENSAKAGVDYDTAIGNNKAIPAGETSVYVPVQTREDDFDESTETLFLDVADVHNATLADGRGTGSILDDDEPAKPKLFVSDETVNEGDAVWFKVFLDQRAPNAVSFDYTTQDGDAKAPADYDATKDFNRVIAKGDTHVWVKVMTREDDFDESNEAFYLKVFDVHGATVADDTGKAVILDDDPTPAPKPTLNVHNDSVDEGGYAYFDVTLSFKAPQDVTFDFATADDSAKHGAALDYIALTGDDVKIPKGSDSVTIAVKTNQDTLDEINETFFLNVSDLKGALPGDLQGKATIVDDDPEPSLAIGSTTITQEGYHAVLKVDLSTASGKTVTVKWATADGTAVKVEDYKAASGTLTFVPGDLSENITLETVAGPPLHELQEVFYVNLSEALNATINQFHKQGTVTIPAD
jgi:chitinase